MNYNFKKDILPILETLYIPDNFYDDSEETFALRNTLEDNFSLITQTGASKLVCILKDKNYVIKIPFKQYLDFDTYFSLSFPIDMKGATGDREDDNWDYCSQEVYLYNLAKLYQIEEAFPETLYLGKYQNWPIYLQEKCITMNNKTFSSPIRRQIDKHEEQVLNLIDENNLPYVNSNWITLFYLKYHQEKTIQLLNFIKYYHIEDLHCDNLGFSIKDNRPVLIDFAGFNK